MATTMTMKVVAWFGCMNTPCMVLFENGVLYEGLGPYQTAVPQNLLEEMTVEEARGRIGEDALQGIKSDAKCWVYTAPTEDEGFEVVLVEISAYQ